MTADPYAAWRHLDGKVVVISFPELIETADGDPAGVGAEHIPALLVLPPADDDSGREGGTS